MGLFVPPFDLTEPISPSGVIVDGWDMTGLFVWSCVYGYRFIYQRQSVLDWKMDVVW